MTSAGHRRYPFLAIESPLQGDRRQPGDSS
jgi:hypothetical protein